MEYFITSEKQLINEIEQILQSKADMTVMAKKASKLISQTLISFRKQIREKGFKKDEDEIYFFRNIKPKIHAYLIFFSILTDIETSKFHMNDEEVNNLIEKKIRMFRHIMRENLDFVTYYMEGLSHLDRQYFLRPVDVQKVTRHTANMMLDPEFNTTYDSVAANIIAQKLLINYLFPEQQNNSKIPKSSKLKWTANKSDFVEFVYGLQATTAINNGDVEIKELCQALQSIFEVQIDDPYRTFIDIVNRKTTKIKFIPTMQEGIKRKIEDADEFEVK
ncbi:MAG: RteC domain-containing protein [Bacteroidota bacterium]